MQHHHRQSSTTLSLSYVPQPTFKLYKGGPSLCSSRDQAKSTLLHQQDTLQTFIFKAHQQISTVPQANKQSIKHKLPARRSTITSTWLPSRSTQQSTTAAFIAANPLTWARATTVCPARRTQPVPLFNVEGQAFCADDGSCNNRHVRVFH